MLFRRAVGLLAIAALFSQSGGWGAPKPSRTPAAPAARRVSMKQTVAYKPFTGEILRTRDIRPGMKGYGLTVFRGTKLERFGVEVISVLHNDSQLGFLGSDLILIRMSGGPITERNANIIAGMSGSPVYIDGKLVGAVSAGFTFSREPQGFVTPIESMMEGLDEKLPPQPLYASALPGANGQPLTLSSLLNGAAQPQMARDPMLPRPLITPVFVSGLSPRNVARLNAALSPYGIEFASAPVGGHAEVDTPLVPGAAIGVSLVSGDIDMTGIGTVTYRKGDRLLAFGHPMYGLGGVEFPMTTAYIHDVLPSYYNSMKLGSPGKIVGTIVQDRPWSIAGVLGRMPKLVDAVINVNDASTGRKKSFHIKTINHPLLSSLFTSIAADEAISRVRSSLGDVMAKVRVQVNAEGLKPIVSENYSFSQLSPGGFAVSELDAISEVLAGSSRIKRVPIESIRMDVELTPGRKTLMIEKAELEKDKLEPGEVARIGVTLRPWLGEPYVETLELRIPATAPNGRTTIAVSGGQVSSLLGGSGGSSLMSLLLGGGGSEETIEQAIHNRIENRDKNNQLVAKLFLNTPSFNVAGEKLLGLPPTVADVMRSQKMTGQRLERDERKVAKDLDGVVTGSPQVLQVIIERKSLAEKNRPTISPAPTTPAPSTPNPSTPPQSRPPSVVSAGPDDDEDPDDGDEEYSLVHSADEPQKPEPSTPDSKGTAKPAEGPAAPADGKAEPARPATPPSRPSSGSSSADQKGPGRTATLWTQRTKKDFDLGDGTSVGVTSEGEVVLVPRVEVASRLSQEAYVWCAVSDGNGGLYLGTGNSGRIYKQTSDGQLSVLYDSPELEIHSLARDTEGNLYAGTSPHGLIYRVTPQGEARVLYETGQRYVMALAVDDSGNVYAGTGPNGRIYKVDAKGSGSLFYDTGEPHVLSLALDPKGNLLAGTSDNGVLFRLSPDGKASVLTDTDTASVTSVAVAKDGTVYLGTGPRGQVVRVSPDGASKTVLNAPAPVMAVAVDDAGTVYAGAGNEIYRVGKDDVTVRLDNDEQNRVLSLLVDGKGNLVATTGNAAATYRLATASKGTYESAVRDAGGPARWGRILWHEAVPKGARITLQTRSGNSAEPDSSWSPWSTAYIDDKGAQIKSPAARFLQYRANLYGSEHGTPKLASVTVSYLTSNRPPEVSFTAPQQGEVWSGKQTVRWTATDPDRDSLTYELFQSRDGGSTWTPLKTLKPSEPAPSDAKTEAPKPAARADERPKTVEVPTAESVLADVTREIEKDKSLSPEDRQLLGAMLPEVVKQAIETPPAKPSPGTRAAETENANKPLRETSFTWDTTEVPSGEYFLKIVASDKRSNPTDFLVEEKVIGPVIIDNDKPKVLVAKDALQVKDGVVTLEGTTRSTRMPILTVSYRVGDGEWAAAEAVDGVFDSTTEAFRIVTDKLSQGDQTIEVKVVDTANNAGTEKVSVKVP